MLWVLIGFVVLAIIVIIIAVIASADEQYKKEQENKKVIDEIYKKYGLSDNNVSLKYRSWEFVFDYGNERFWFANYNNGYWMFQPFSNIIGCEIRIKGTTSKATTKGGLKNAVIGGVLFGGVGAIVGGITAKRKTETNIENSSMELLIYFNSTDNPLLRLELQELDNTDICDQVHARINAIING